MSFNKQLRDQFQEKTLPTVQAAEVSSMLGFIGSMAIDSIINDVKIMIEKDRRPEIDGYVLALSRIVKHDLALNAIQSAYKDKGEQIPKKYLDLFKNQIESKQGIFVK